MNEKNSSSKTVLGADCRITGELALDNDAVIMGQFKGTLRVSGVLEVTDSARVSGTIVAGAVRVSGRIEANVVAEHGVELLAGGHLNGQLYTTTLSVVEGAILQSEVCVGPKAMQAAGALLRQVQASIAEEQEDSEDLALDQDQENAVEEHAHRAAAANDSAEGENEDREAEPAMNPVRTVPSTLNSMLSRRRAKVLSSYGIKPVEGETHAIKNNPSARAS